MEFMTVVLLMLLWPQSISWKLDMSSVNGGASRTITCDIGTVLEVDGIKRLAFSQPGGTCMCHIRVSNASQLKTASLSLNRNIPLTSAWNSDTAEFNLLGNAFELVINGQILGGTSSAKYLETDCISFDLQCYQDKFTDTYDPHMCQTTTTTTEQSTSRTTVPGTNPVNPVSTTNSDNTQNTTGTGTISPNVSTGSNAGIIAGVVCVVLALLIIAALIILFILYKQGRFGSCLGFKSEKQGDSDRYDDVVTGDTISPYSETESKRYQAENSSPAVPSAVARNRGQGPSGLGVIREETSPYGVTHMDNSNAQMLNGEISPYGVTAMSNFHQSKMPLPKDEISPYGTTEMSKINQSNTQREISPYGVTETKTTYHPHIMNSQVPVGIPQGEVSPYGVTEMSQIQSRERLDPTLHYADINVDMLAPKPVESPYEISNIGPGSITYADLAISNSGDSKPKPKIKSKPNVNYNRDQQSDGLYEGANRDQQGDDGLYEGVTKPDIASLYAQPIKKKDRN